MATCLLVIVGQALVTAWAGSSMGLRRICCRDCSAETEFRREIEVTIEPFKGLLWTFFRSIGAGLDIAAVISDPHLIFINALGLIAVKAIIVFLLSRIFGVERSAALEAAMLERLEENLLTRC